MFESHYGKPFVIAMGITLILITGMGFSLRGMVGTGANRDPAEISFNLPEEADSSTGVDTPLEKESSMEAPLQSLETTGSGEMAQETRKEEQRTQVQPETVKGSDMAVNGTGPRREWAVPKGLENDESNPDQVVVTKEKQTELQPDKSMPPNIGSVTTSDPNANGNGILESDADLSFLSVLAWSLLTPGQQELLRQPTINPSIYLRHVQELGAASSVKGAVTVKVNFDIDGHVIVAHNTPRIVADNVPSDVMEEALRIVKSSGNIINNSGRPQTLTIPVVLGQ